MGLYRSNCPSSSVNSSPLMKRAAKAEAERPPDMLRPQNSAAGVNLGVCEGLDTTRQRLVEEGFAAGPSTEPRVWCGEGPAPCTQRSETLPVDDGRARLVILTLGDPHLLEGAQRRQDGASDPHRVLALWRSHDLDLHRGGSKGREFFRHALANACEHGGAPRQHHVSVEVLTDVHIALHDRLEGGVMNAAGLLAHEAWLEEHLRAAEALAADRDDVPVWELVGLFLPM